VSLSAAIVVKDQADDLDACLRSLHGLVHEIIVVETGSTDASAEVAEAHGAVVVHEPWPSDFATPRNRGLELATGDWILYVEADEEVQGDFAAAREMLDQTERTVAYRVPYVPRAGWTPSRECRLWRNRPDIRFADAMHDTVVPAVDAVAAAEHFGVAAVDRVTIHHDRSERDRPEKRARDELLLRAELARHPNCPFVYDHLARVYESSGDGERAVATWKEGIGRARARGHLDPDDRLLYVDLIQHLLARGVIDDELGALVEEACEQFVRTPTLELAAARLAFATGRPREAIEPLEWLLALDAAAIVDTGASYDARVFGEWAWGLLGLCWFALGDDAAAVDAFGRAEQLAPEDPSYGVRRRLAEARANRPATE
jgi:glycosyltransferase involved in cell wall biosynthesis